VIPSEMLLRLVVCAILLVGAVFYTIEALSFELEARYVPLLAGAGATLLLTLVVIREVVRIVDYSMGERRALTQTLEGGSEVKISSAMAIASIKYIGWMLLLLVFVWQAGLLVAGPIFAGVFLRVDSRVSLRISVSVGLGLLGLFLFLGEVVDFRFP
jgi:hypothetical protein